VRETLKFWKIILITANLDILERIAKNSAGIAKGVAAGKTENAWRDVRSAGKRKLEEKM